MHPDPFETVVRLHERDSPVGGALGPGKAQRDELVVGDVRADLALGPLDPLLDLGQKLIDQLGTGRGSIRQRARVAGRDWNVPGLVDTVLGCEFVNISVA